MSSPRLGALSFTGSDPLFSVEATNGSQWVVQTTDDLRSGSWAVLQTVDVVESNRIPIRVPAVLTGEQAFFQARLPRPATSEELARYADAAAWDEPLGGKALLVMQDGAIVFERYADAAVSNTPHLLASGTKSFSAALYALGEADGIWTLDENVSQTITEWQGDTNRSQIAIWHLLTLSSGLKDSPDWNPLQTRFLDSYSMAINDSTSEYPPGVAIIYGACNFQVLAALFERKTGRDPVEYLDERLFSKIGIGSDSLSQWTRDLENKPQMAGGASLTPREWIAYGKLWMQNGSWQGEPLLDAKSVRQTVSYRSEAFLGYGLTWWLNRPREGTYNPEVDRVPPGAIGDGEQLATNAPADMYVAAGAGKQMLYMIPSLNLVVLRMGMTLTNPDWSDRAFLGRILGVP